MSSQRRPKQENLKQKETMIMKTKLMKIITSCSLFACALASLAAATMLGTAGVARASSPQQTCSVRTLRGEYVLRAHGYKIIGGVAVKFDETDCYGLARSMGAKPVRSQMKRLRIYGRSCEGFERVFTDVGHCLSKDRAGVRTQPCVENRKRSIAK